MKNKKNLKGLITTLFRNILILSTFIFAVTPYTIWYMLVDDGRILTKEYVKVCKMMLWAFGVKLIIDGKIPKDGEQRVIMINHGSVVDMLITGIYFDGETGIAVVAKKLFYIPIFRFWLRRTNTIGLNRKSTKDQLRVYREMDKVLREGKNNLFICPEGERTTTGEMLPFKLAIFKLVVKYNKTIVPVSVIGAFEIKNKKSFFIAPGAVTMINKKLIQGKGKNPEDLAKEVKKEIMGNIEKFKNSRYST
ncbi:MAG: lysophospholipid acyltransferase family protein [Candidatus Nomurabacteria bacterium]|nr:lysophospholipid acyltransferase family protein [Candidatus Nomurabacteria bacterium]